jgi:hypothetical protein
MADEDQGGGTHAYRAKLMDRAGRIETTVAIMATTDRDALEQVRGLAKSYHVELWDGGRLVLRVPFDRPT